jgi:hypothetical protein
MITLRIVGAIIIAMLVSACQTAAVQPDQPIEVAQTSIELGGAWKTSGSGTWKSKKYPQAGGGLQVEFVQKVAGSPLVGSVTFLRSSCPDEKPFDNVVVAADGKITMKVNLGGPCKEVEIVGKIHGKRFVGTYKAGYPDNGTVELQLKQTPI